MQLWNNFPVPLLPLSYFQRKLFAITRILLLNFLIIIIFIINIVILFYFKN